MCITGYWHVRKLGRADIEALSESVPEGPSTRKLLRLSEQYGLALGAGLIERSKEGRLYNTYVVVMPNGQTARHRKLHCFISEHMASGDAYTVFDIPQGARVGVLTCYDNNIIENVRITALKGAEILLAPHQTGGCDTPSPRCMGLIDPKLWDNRDKDPAALEAEFRGPKGRDWLMRWLPARAHDNGMFLIFSNGVGLDDNEVRTGNAMILDPYGEILAETWQAEETMVMADLDASRLDMCTGSRWIRSRRPELYELLTVPTGSERDIRTLRFAGKRK
jgi:predicted amidohydrolase